jgi:ribosomal protein S18 acetylase RimI-like enzyme
MPTIVRKAEAADAAAVENLKGHVHAVHASARSDMFRVPREKGEGERLLDGALADPQQQVFVAEDGGSVVGYVHIVLKHTPASDDRVDRHYSEIDTVAVHPEAQRLGIGRRLIEAALKWASTRGIVDHQIAAHEFNQAALALYEGLGFSRSVTMLRRIDSRSAMGR